jgi:transposase
MEISDELWKRVEALLPPPEPRAADKRYRRRAGGGRKPRAQRPIFEAILYVLRTRCAWQRMPAQLGSVSTVHRYFNRWEQSGMFHEIWISGLAVHPELQGIHWVCEHDGHDDHASIRWRPVHGAPRGRPRKQAPAQQTNNLEPSTDSVSSGGDGAAQGLARTMRNFISGYQED